MAAIKVVSLPATGALRLAGVAVTAGQEIAAAQLDTLTFTPAADWHGDATFGWQGSDGNLYSAAAETVTLTLAPVDDAPVVAEFARTAPAGQPVHFSQSDFVSHFADVDGDPLAAVRIESLPGHGGLVRGAVPVSAGDVIQADQLNDLIYWPEAGWQGTVSFQWNGSDGMAYAARNAIVTLHIVRQVFLPVVVR